MSEPTTGTPEGLEGVLAAARQRRLRTLFLMLSPALALVVFTATDLVRGRALIVVSDYLQLAAPALAAALTWRAARPLAGRAKVSLRLFALAAASWGAGQLAWTILEVHLRLEPYPSVADVGFVLFMPLALAAFLVGAPGRMSLRRCLDLVLDGGVALCGLFIVLWVVVLDALVAGVGVFDFAAYLAFFYPISDIVLFGVALTVIANAPPGQRATFLPWLCGVGFIGLADVSYAALTARGIYKTGALLDAGWLAGFLVLAWAAAMVPAAGPAPAMRPFRGGVVLPMLAPYFSLVAATIAFAFHLREHDLVKGEVDPQMLVAGIVLIFALVTRQLLLLYNDSLVRDLADRNLAAQTMLVRRLEESQEGLEAARAAVHMGTWEADAATGAVSWSAEMYVIFGVGHEDAPHDLDAFMDFVLPNDRPTVARLFEEAQGNGASYSGDVKIARRDGSGRSVNIQVWFVRNLGRRPRFVGVVHDIGERVEAEARRIEASRREAELRRIRDTETFRARFVNMAAHELRTPLSPVRIHLHRLKEGDVGPLPPEQRQVIEVIDRNVHRIEALLSDVLDSARLQAGRFPIKPVPIQMDGAVREELASFVPVAAERGVDVDAEVEPCAPLPADPVRVRQVLSNLLSNAVKFTPPGGRIAAGCREAGDGVEVWVRDTGVGISPEEAGRLFQPFERVDRTAKTGPDAGTGLGLYLSREIVAAHGGRIWCESPGVDRGTTFRFVLPRRALPRDGAVETSFGLDLDPRAP